MKNKLITMLVGMALITMSVPDVCFALTETEVTVDAPIEISISTDDKTTAQEAADSLMTPDMSGNDTVLEYTDIQIGSAEELIAFSKACRLDTYSADKRVTLTQDISLFDADFVTIPTFGGIFDGQGHTIKGLIITGDDSYVGLFSYLRDTALVTDLNVEGVIDPSSKAIAVGGIAGDNYGIINRCTFYGTVKGNNYVGGIAGFNEAGALIIDCNSRGEITGKNYTGGICGENVGGISGCVNNASVNTANDDTTQSLTDIDIDKYKEKLMALFNDEDAIEKTESDSYSNPMDTGGIAGLSLGAIAYCVNNGDIGYPHVGYNTGGIAGRSSGYLYADNNTGNVKGRKDIGGIAGQAEPYVQLNLTDDIIAQITDNVNRLHDLIDVTLNDAGASSDTVSMRLNVVKSFADKALDDTGYLANSTIAFVDSSISSANDAINRIEYVVNESNKSGGAIDSTRSSLSGFKDTFNSLKSAASDANAYSYLTDSEKAEYDAANKQAEDETAEYEGYADAVKNDRAYYYKDLSANVRNNTKEYYGHEDDLFYYHDNGDGTYIRLVKVSDLNSANKDDYRTFNVGGTDYTIDGAAHFDADENKTDFPSQAEGQAGYDNALKADTEAMVASDAKEQADIQYGINHPGHTYSGDMTDNITTMTTLLARHETEIAQNEEKDLQTALSQAQGAVGNLENAGKSIKEIADNLSGRGDITLNMLGSDYQARANSLNTNMRGISDNLGLLNAEMNNATDVMIEDLSGVNDQFNTLMLLFTDAIDGALEMDYSTVYEDSSEDVAETCIDGTVASCINYGLIEGDIDTAGIIGTMAIDYDFDSESDTTGVKDSKANSSYITKCVARDDINRGRVQSLKSYCGGVTGLQEMGTILRCESFGNVLSDSGDYVGGIAGRALSNIKSSYSKGVFKGTRYVGGICGMSNNISDSYSIPCITGAKSYYGAIAGSTEDDAVLKGNYFVSDELAGTDRISYAGKAEPVSYPELMGLYNVPADFSLMNITFVSDGEVKGNISVEYGKALTADMYPSVETDGDSYIKWEPCEVDSVVSDMEIEAESVRYVTTLADVRLREDGQSVILADGRFLDTDELDIEILAPISLPLEHVREAYRVTNPDDNSNVHTLRYHPLEDDEEVTIYVNNNGSWQKTACKEYGRYLLFNYSGNSVEFAVCAQKKDMRLYYVIAGATCLILLTGVIYILILRSKRSHKKGAKCRKKLPTPAPGKGKRVNQPEDIITQRSGNENTGEDKDSSDKT
ncbi:MAG: hypothetical protein K6G22_13280 [Lachnospiraceae bacterium]|nr:hypothetical protein [Lachnospiraceae bacterium]